MDFEKFTDRARGFVQSAQSLALREGHQQFSTEHLLKVLLDDPEGLAAGLIDRSGGQSRQALQAVEASLARRPKKRVRRPETVSLRSNGCCSRCRWRRTAKQERYSRRRVSRRRI